MMALEDIRLEASGEEKPQTKHADEGGIVASSELLDEFASYTTLHGFHFILGSCSLIRRIVWGLLLVTGLAMLIMQCLYGFSKLADHDSVTVKEQQRDEKITFPAVTICNLNMLRKDKILGTEAQKFMDKMESVVFGERLNDDANEPFTLDLERVVKEAGHNISEMLSLCRWHGRLCGPKDFFVFVSLLRGLCYTFNSGKPGYPLLEQSSAGRSEGLLLQLNAQPEQYYGAFNVFEGTGFRMVVHDQSEWPDMENHGIDVSPGFSNTVRIQRHKTIRLGPPYKSKCGERKLASFKTYSHSACFLECWTRAIIDRCHCLTLGMAQLDETKNLSYCGPKELLNCVIPVNGKLLGSLECDCPIKCETIHYEVQLSSSSYPSRHLLPMLVRRMINESVVLNATDKTWSEIEAMFRYVEFDSF
ncbi:acid-sensing ion channel 1-like [Orbicella faveolata]|uniref:acid-sensing ion channel 1-like n=1 Tax=Orbicella faveolata TaxID=48498 RepID=UPI0009E508BB|nr:acid-sensing ion channel 1-like [Orbicella faveolata]